MCPAIFFFSGGEISAESVITEIRGSKMTLIDVTEDNENLLPTATEDLPSTKFSETTPGRASTNVRIELSGRPVTPGFPKEIEPEESVLLLEQKLHKYNKLPKPVWPKTSPTIPSTVFKANNERVMLLFAKMPSNA